MTIFLVSDWFPGWPQHQHYNKQPNDDGLSEQDCVEVRRTYTLPSTSVSLAPGFMWNDRDCATHNYFICEKLQNDGKSRLKILNQIFSIPLFSHETRVFISFHFLVESRRHILLRGFTSSFYFWRENWYIFLLWRYTNYILRDEIYNVAAERFSGVCFIYEMYEIGYTIYIVNW